VVLVAPKKFIRSLESGNSKVRFTRQVECPVVARLGRGAVTRKSVVPFSVLCWVNPGRGRTSNPSVWARGNTAEWTSQAATVCTAPKSLSVEGPLNRSPHAGLS